MGKSAVSMLGLSTGLEGAEMELQKMLIDERMKCESHRTNYQTLKAEHARQAHPILFIYFFKFSRYKTFNLSSVGCSLEDEYSRLQGEVKRLRNERQSQQDKVQLLLAELRGDLLDKTREVEELRLQVKCCF